MQDTVPFEACFFPMDHQSNAGLTSERNRHRVVHQEDLNAQSLVGLVGAAGTALKKKSPPSTCDHEAQVMSYASWSP
ncbi:hypothetical protein [Actinosynnema sp. ALI-1.44]|uniref:hypothetical protein n=1 Tax=Actinosynnema sp. ALI-1.44 TaxID=1933779 RepID=UPI0011774B15|nr:hypothetical protein [Actinosynnema sp. ALI-1.44]